MKSKINEERENPRNPEHYKKFKLRKKIVKTKCFLILKFKSQKKKKSGIPQEFQVEQKIVKLNEVKKCSFFPDSKVNSIGVCAGSGSSVLVGCSADLWITGEMSHHEVLDAVHNGTSVILCEHSNTERGYLKVFAEKLNVLLEQKVQIDVSSLDKDPLSVM